MASASSTVRGMPVLRASTARLMTTRWSLCPCRTPAGACSLFAQPCTVMVPPSLSSTPPQARSSASMAAMRSLSFRRKRSALRMTVVPSHSRPSTMSTGPRSGQSARSMSTPCSGDFVKGMPSAVRVNTAPHRRRISRMAASPCSVSGARPVMVTPPHAAPSTAGNAA
ncbi:Uncharacterised protein [uncultured Clostridium sp.]|nr:Uncharacterised protein [uncultured Clostridium sp.]